MDDAEAQTAPVPTPASPARRRRWFRFSLLTLLFFVLLAGAVTGVWQKRAPWIFVGQRSHQWKGATTNAVRYSPDDRHVLVAAADGNAHLWDALTLSLRHTLRHGDSIHAAVFSADCKSVVTAGSDNQAKVWDVATGALLATAKGHSSWIRSAACSHHGRRFVTGSDDFTARVWDLDTGAELKCLRGHRRGVQCVAFSPDDRHIATASDDGTARLWDAESGASLGVLQPHPGTVYVTAFSPDGRMLTTAGLEGSVRLWNVPECVLRADLVGHSSRVQRLAFCPDGSRLATASEDATMRIWDTVDGHQRLSVTTWPGHYALDVQSVSFFDGASCVLVGYDNEPVQVFDAAHGRLLKVTPSGWGPAASGPSRMEVAHLDSAGNLCVWRRRHPEYWWGLAWLPEFWLAVLFGSAFVWSVWRDRRTL